MKPTDTARLQQQVRTLTARLADHDRALASASADVENLHRHTAATANAARTLEVQTSERIEAASRASMHLREGLAALQRLVQSADTIAATLTAALPAADHATVPQPVVEQLLGERFVTVLDERDALQVQLAATRKTLETERDQHADQGLQLKKVLANGAVPHWLARQARSIAPDQQLSAEDLLDVAVRALNWAFQESGSKMRINLDRKPAPAPAPASVPADGGGDL